MNPQFTNLQVVNGKIVAPVASADLNAEVVRVQAQIAMFQNNTVLLQNYLASLQATQATVKSSI